MADDEAKVVAKGAWTIVCPPALLACASAAEGGGEYAAAGGAGADAALRSCGKTMDDKSILNLALPPDPEAEAEALEDDEDMVRGGGDDQKMVWPCRGGEGTPDLVTKKKRGNARGA